jgi:hypothetical protein
MPLKGQLVVSLVVAVLSCVPAQAEELNARQLYAFCTSEDEVVKAACRFYVLGAATGIALGDGLTRGAEGNFVARKKTHCCMPDDTPQSAMVDAFVQSVRLLLTKYPEDLKLSAVSIVDAAMQQRFPCPR